MNFCAYAWKQFKTFSLIKITNDLLETWKLEYWYWNMNQYCEKGIALKRYFWCKRFFYLFLSIKMGMLIYYTKNDYTENSKFWGVSTWN